MFVVVYKRCKLVSIMFCVKGYNFHEYGIMRVLTCVSKAHVCMFSHQNIYVCEVSLTSMFQILIETSKF